jgi:hypothetical protein
MELSVHGKTVRVRDSYKGREWYSLPGLYRRAWKGAADGNYASCIPFLARVVEWWEFEGDPADEGAYEALDILAELVPLADQALLAVSEAAFPPAAAGE